VGIGLPDGPGGNALGGPRAGGEGRGPFDDAGGIGGVSTFPIREGQGKGGAGGDELGGGAGGRRDWCPGGEAEVVF